MEGQSVNDIRFADDQDMVADTEMGLQRLINKFSDTSKNIGMQINVPNTKNHGSSLGRRWCC